MNKSIEDLVIIQEILNGNHEAEEILYKKYKNILKSYIISRYSQYSDLEDDISEILIKVFLNLSSFNPEKSSFKSWVITLGKNYLIDKWRSNCNNTATYITYNADNTMVDDILYTNNNSSYNEFEGISTIAHISNQITSKDFDLLNMKYIQGYNYEEIGKIYEYTSSTVSNKINYIKTKLRKSLNKENL